MQTLTDFRKHNFGVAMKYLHAECSRFGIDDLWQADLQSNPRIRAVALDGRTDRLASAISQALHHAGKIGLPEAVKLLADRRAELAALEVEAEQFRREAAVAPAVDVIVLDDDWGRRGRGARIVAAIRGEGLTAGEVAERFQLAVSTARKYVSKAKQG